MKKFFSLIALVGVIAACTPEQIDTAFSLPGASGEITVEVLNLDGTDYEGQFTVSGFENWIGNPSVEYQGNKAYISFQLNESEAILNPVDLTLKVDGQEIYNPVYGKVRVPAVLAGGHVDLYCQVKVGEVVGDYWVYEDGEYEYEDMTVELTGTLVNSHYTTHAYTHEGIDSWFINDTDLYLTGVVEIPVVEGYSEGYDIEKFVPAGFEDGFLYEDITGEADYTTVDEWIEYWGTEDIDEYTEDIDIFVSAWAMWNVPVYTVTLPCTVTLLAYNMETEEEIQLATVSYDVIGTYTPGAVELPYPGMPGHAHYEPGHGHGHGGENAGGGISINE